MSFMSGTSFVRIMYLKLRCLLAEAGYSIEEQEQGGDKRGNACLELPREPRKKRGKETASSSPEPCISCVIT